MAKIVLVGNAASWIGQRLLPALLHVGYEVVALDDGLSAAKYVLAQPPDAVVTSLDLSGMSGAQLCRLLHGDAATARVPVVLLAASANGPSRLWARTVEHTPCIEEEDVDAVLAIVSQILEGAVPRPEIDPGEPIPSRVVLHRLSSVLDGALIDAAIASEVRALATAGSTEALFRRLTGFAADLLGYEWLALLVDGATPRVFLHARTEALDVAEQEARAALDAPPGATLVTIPGGDVAPTSGTGGAIEVPLFFGEAKVGQIAVGIPRRAASRAKKRLVDLIAYDLGGPLCVRLLMEQAEVLASTDSLTGLVNRRAFLEAADRERSRSARRGGSTALAVLDLDHFKRVNDEHGHDAGDAVLVHVARVLRETARASDLVARWGGEELVVLLPETSVAGATAVLERMREAIEASPVQLARGALRATASFGFAVATGLWEPEDLLQRADAAMYEAKRLGRNRVVAGFPAPTSLIPRLIASSLHLTGS